MLFVQKSRVQWVVGGGAALAALFLFSGAPSEVARVVRSIGFSYGGPDKNGLSRDPSLLLPSFAARVETLFQRLRARGFDPFLNEGYRTQARAAQLAAEGPGIVDSMHCYGAAADIKSFSRGFEWPEFFVALGQEAEKLGLTWGGRFPNGDGPHVQALTVKAQPTFRALTASAREPFVKKSMGVA